MVVTVAVFAYAASVVASCRSDSTLGCETSPADLYFRASTFYFRAFLLVLAATTTFMLGLCGLALLLDRGRRRRYRNEVEPRRVAASAWVSEGRLTQEAHAQLENAYEAFALATFPGGATRVAAQTFLFTVAPAILAALIFLFAFASESSSPTARPGAGELPFLVASFLFLLVVGSYSLYRGMLLQIRHRRHLQQARADLATLEGALLGPGGSYGTPSAAVATPSGRLLGPTFRPWGRGR